MKNSIGLNQKKNQTDIENMTNDEILLSIHKNMKETIKILHGIHKMCEKYREEYQAQ